MEGRRQGRREAWGSPAVRGAQLWMENAFMFCSELLETPASRPEGSHGGKTVCSLRTESAPMYA